MIRQKGWIHVFHDLKEFWGGNPYYRNLCRKLGVLLQYLKSYDSSRAAWRRIWGDFWLQLHSFDCWADLWNVCHRGLTNGYIFVSHSMLQECKAASKRCSLYKYLCTLLSVCVIFM